MNAHWKYAQMKYCFGPDDQRARCEKYASWKKWRRIKNKWRAHENYYLLAIRETVHDTPETTISKLRRNDRFIEII